MSHNVHYISYISIVGVHFFSFSFQQYFILVAGLVSSLACSHHHYWDELYSPFSASSPNAARSRASFFALGPPDSGPPHIARNSSSAFCFVWARCRALSPNCCRGLTRKGQNQLPCSYALRVCSPVSPAQTTGSALQCFPSEVHAYLW